jgi:hypothetical protein
MTWGKVDPDRLPDAVVCYTDSTIALPLLTAFALARREPRPLKRLYDRREAMYDRLRAAYLDRVSSGLPTGIASREKQKARGQDEPSRDPSHPDTVDRAR